MTLRAQLWVLAVFGCTSKDTPNADASQSSPDDTETELPPLDSGIDTAPPEDEYGLETRPLNDTCTAPPRPPSGASVALSRVFPMLSFDSPVEMIHAPGDTSRWFVVEQTGRVHGFENDPEVSTTTIAINLASDIDVNYESGLLGMAFHPDFDANGEVFLSYNPPRGSGIATRISRFYSPDGGNSIDPDTESIIFEVDQPYNNHNGGRIAFGPNGYLFIGLGDGGSGGDPLGNGQDTDTVLGAMLRIDVDTAVPYAIPSDNPFADGGGAGEIYAWGLRNPWRWFFDPATGDLWVGDVGQNAWEELDRVELGGNYGWNHKEGNHCFAIDPCDEGGLIDPEAEYPNTSSASIVAGPVYRGSTIDGLDGVPIYTDFFTGEVWGLFTEPSTGLPDPQILIASAGIRISSFAQDAAGEVFALSYYGGGIFQFVADAAPTTSEFPTLLSETGCTDPDDATAPAAGLIPYDVAVPLWSDAAEKERWLGLPDGETITVDDHDWDLPIGSVVVKHFSLAGSRFETRLFVRHENGEWAGYTYRWNDAGTDATWVPTGATITIDDQQWRYPTSGECLQCHTQAAGRTLGLETRQLNTELTYPNGVTANQLETLDRIGIFDPPLIGTDGSASDLPSMPADETDPIDQRARAYLHTNCSICHRPEGTGAGTLDLRVTTPTADMGACLVPPENGDLGQPDAVLLAPGEPERSIISLRMHTLDANRMPPLASQVVDITGTELIDAWISAIEDCP